MCRSIWMKHDLWVYLSSNVNMIQNHIKKVNKISQLPLLHIITSSYDQMLILYLKYLCSSNYWFIQKVPYSDLWCHISPIIYLLQMFWVIDLVIDIRHHLQRTTQRWNRLPVIRKTQQGLRLIIQSLSIWLRAADLYVHTIQVPTKIKSWMQSQPVETHGS